MLDMTLNEQISKKAKQTRQEAVSFESALAAQFKELTNKTGDNVKIISKQVDLHKQIADKENTVANEVGIISAMLSKNALLESLVFAKIEEKLSVFPRKTEEDEIKEPTVTEAPKAPKKKKKKPSFSLPSIPLFSRKPRVSSPPKSMASGGVVPGSSKIAQQTKQNSEIPYADTMQVSLEASGLAAVSTLSEFIKGTGGLGGFFLPYYKSIVEPFALALGVSKDSLHSLLGAPLQTAKLTLRDDQKYFGKMWAKFLNDPDFVNKFIDREATGDPNDPNRPPGYVPADWKDDPEFSAALNELCKKWGINANHLLGLMAIETASAKINPAADNGHHAGLIQFSYGFIQNTAKMSVEDFKKLSRAQQIPYVDKYFEMNNLPKNPTAGQLYTMVFLPAFIPYAKDRNTVLASSSGYNSTPLASQFSKSEIAGWWEGNPTLRGPVESDITVGDLEDRIKESCKNIGVPFARGGSLQTVAPLSLILGSKSGYPVSFDGETTAFTGHGFEIIENGKVYPIDTPAFNLFANKEKTFVRWAEIYYDKSFDINTAIQRVTSNLVATSEVAKPKVIINAVPGEQSSSVNVTSTDTSSRIQISNEFNPHLFNQERYLLSLK